MCLKSWGQNNYSKKKDLSSNSTQMTTSTSEGGKKAFESLGPLPIVDLGAPDGRQRLQRMLTRRLATVLASSMALVRRLTKQM